MRKFVNTKALALVGCMMVSPLLAKAQGYTGPTTEVENYSGAYYTGKYTSPFKTVLGKTDAEIKNFVFFMIKWRRIRADSCLLFFLRQFIIS